MNLLTLTDQEYKKEMNDYDEYIQKHCRFKHYRDKETLLRKRGRYFFPIGEKYRNPCGLCLDAFKFTKSKGGYQ